MTQASLDPAGPVAEGIEGLWWFLFWMGAAVFAVFAVLLALGLFRSHDGPATGERQSVRRWVLGGGVLMPLVVVAVVLGATVYGIRALPTTAPSDNVTVEIVGHQWWFEVRYPDEGITVRDELHLPVGQWVELRLTSADVIHSFWVPELGGKIDMLPETTNSLVLRADEAGRYQSRCAEFCGLHHADMKLQVLAEPVEDFQAWLEAQR